MMHSAKLVRSKVESDGAISVVVRCCDDPTTDQGHTLYLKPDTPDEEIQDWIAACVNNCAVQHATRDRAHVIINRGVK